MKIYTLILSLFLSSCAYGDIMKKIESLMDTVKQSPTSELEADNTEKVWHYIAKEGISIQVLVLQGNGEEVDINSFDNAQAISEVKIIFEKGDKHTSIVWKPKDVNNVFILFQE